MTKGLMLARPALVGQITSSLLCCNSILCFDSSLPVCSEVSGRWDGKLDEYKLSHCGDVLSCGPASQFGRRERWVLLVAENSVFTQVGSCTVLQDAQDGMWKTFETEAAKFFSVTQQKNHRLMKLNNKPTGRSRNREAPPANCHVEREDPWS